MRFLLSVALAVIVSAELIAAQAPDPSPGSEPVVPRRDPEEPVIPMPQETNDTQAAPDLLPESGTVPITPPIAVAPGNHSVQPIPAVLQKSARVEKDTPPSNNIEALLRKARTAKTAARRREYLKAYRAAIRAKGKTAGHRDESRSARLRHGSHVYLQSRRSRHYHHSHHTYLEQASRHHKHAHHSHRHAVVYEYIDYGPE